MSRPRWDRWATRRLREYARDNQWLLPALGAIAGLALALAVRPGDEIDSHGWTVTVDRSRDTLISALGLSFTAFSIVLALASVAAQNVVSRFGSRVLRIYTRRSALRWVIAVFAFTTLFILTGQFQLRVLEPDSPAPVATLMISVILLVISGSTLVWYVGWMVRWFRVDKAVGVIISTERHALAAAEQLRTGAEATSIPVRPDTAINLLSPRSGHLAEFDTDSMLDRAAELETLVVITHHLGAPVVQRQPIGWLDTQTESGATDRMAALIDVSRTRELSDSIEYGLYALVDIAIIALSPAVNDPNSAVEVIEEISFLFPEIAAIPLGPYAFPDAESLPRVVVMARSFGELVELATTQIVLYGMSDPNVVNALRRFADSLNLLDLSESDQRYVDEFAAKLDDGRPTASS